MVKVSDIAAAIEEFAPVALQESYDNAGLQVGDPDMQVSAALLCLDVTEEIIAEARKRRCNMVISHHPLLFKGLKRISGSTPVERVVIEALREGIAIYSAHTNLDSAWDGVSHEIAHALGAVSLRVLDPKPRFPSLGLGIVGDITPTPKMEFLRKVKEIFNVRSLRYSGQSSALVIRRIAVCGGSGASLIPLAVKEGADIFISGDIKYHDFTDRGAEILLADIGHYESELCSRKIFSRIIREKYPDCVVCFSESERNPVKYL